MISCLLVNNDELDKANSEFWDELCGSLAAERLGITDNSETSLRLFDEWYFDYYDYLKNYIPFERFSGEKVLEIGLGYGSVSQRIMEAGAQYHGVDISSGPVEFSKYRASLKGFSVNPQVASALDLPYPDNTFDAVISIGCLHHTGDLSRAFEEITRVTKPRGTLHLMVYSSHSHRQLTDNPITWAKELLFNKPTRQENNIEADKRAKYDANSKGNAAPHVTLTSIKDLHMMLSDLNDLAIVSENSGFSDYVIKYIQKAIDLWFLLKRKFISTILSSNQDDYLKVTKSRELSDDTRLKLRRLSAPLGRLSGMGTDLYVIARKP